MAGKDWNSPLTKKELEEIQKKLKGKGGSPGQVWKKKASRNRSTLLAGNPSFDINETPATRRTRKIRTLQERGVGGESGNASDILKRGIQLPDIKAKKKKKNNTRYT